MGAPLPQLNRIAIGADEAAPEADLSQMMIRRRKSAAAERVAALEIVRSDAETADATVGDGLFFKKGFATAEGFRPSYWVYERHSRDEPPATPAAVAATPDAPAARVASSVPINLDAEPNPEDETELADPAAGRGAPQPGPLGDAPGIEPEADLSTILIGRSSARTASPPQARDGVDAAMAKAPLFEVKRDTATPFVAAAFVAEPQAPPERAIPSLLAAKLAENNARLGRAADAARAPAPAAERDAPPPPEPVEPPPVALEFPASAAAEAPQSPAPEAAPVDVLPVAPEPPASAAAAPADWSPVAPERHAFAATAPVDVLPVAPEPPAPAAAASEEWPPVAPEPAAPAPAAAAVIEPDPVPVTVPPLPAAVEADVPLPPLAAPVLAAPPSPLAETGPDSVEATLFAALDLAAALDLPLPTPAAAPDAPPAVAAPPLVEPATDFVPTPEPEPGDAAPEGPAPEPATDIAEPAAGTDASWIALYEESVAALAVRREDAPTPAHAAEAIGPSAALGLRDPQPGATPATARPPAVALDDVRPAKAPQPGLVTEITQVIESVLSSKSYWAQQAPGGARAPERASRPRGGRTPARGRGRAAPVPPPAASSGAAPRQSPSRAEPGMLARAWRAVRVVVLAVVVTVLTGNLLSPGFWTGLLDRMTPPPSVSVPIPQAAPESAPPRAHKPTRSGRAAETR